MLNTITDSLKAKLLIVHERLCQVYHCPIRYFHNLNPLSEQISAMLSHRTRNADSASWNAQQVYDHHEICMLHGQMFCYYKSPSCHRCHVLALCPFGQARQETKQTAKTHKHF